jgi:hypothetical protein
MIDLADTGCSSSVGNMENPQCSDGYDNDGDGRIDFGSDTDCTASFSNRELALPQRDCHAGRMHPVQGAAWFAMVFAALWLGTRRRRA